MQKRKIVRKKEKGEQAGRRPKIKKRLPQPHVSFTTPFSVSALERPFSRDLPGSETPPPERPELGLRKGCLRVQTEGGEDEGDQQIKMQIRELKSCDWLRERAEPSSPSLAPYHVCRFVYVYFFFLYFCWEME